MEKARLIQPMTVFNKPFFVNELLRIVQPGSITPEIFAEMVNDSRPYDISTILTAMTRQIDNSGVATNLAGVHEDQQDVLEVLMNLAHQQLTKIARLDPEIQIEVFDTLKGDQGTSLRALLVLDDCHEEVIHQLNHLRQQSPLALALRRVTEAALRALYKVPGNLSSPMFEDVIGYQDRSVMYKGEPHISYPKHVFEGGVVEVWQFFFMPAIEDIRLPVPFNHHSVGEVIAKITPKVYRRGITDDSDYNPRSPSGFMGPLGKVGGALPRLIARQVKRNEQLHEQVMREEEIAFALNDLFSQ